MKQLEESIMCDRILNENICNGRSQRRQGKRIIKTAKFQEKAKNVS